MPQRMMPKRLSVEFLGRAIMELALEKQELVVGTFPQLADRFSQLREAAGYKPATISGMRYQLPYVFENLGAHAPVNGPVMLPITDALLIELVKQRFGEVAAHALITELGHDPTCQSGNLSP